MSKEVILKKRKALRSQIAQITNTAEQQIDEGANRLLTAQAQIKGIRESLKSANNRKFLTDNANAELDSIIEYDMKITTLARLKLGTREHAQMDLSNGTRQDASTSVVQDAVELTKLPKLEMVKFARKAIELRRFWAICR